MYGRLQDSGYFFDPVQREVEQQVMPWLLQETQNEVARRNTARSAAPPYFQSCCDACLHYTPAALLPMHLEEIQNEVARRNTARSAAFVSAESLFACKNLNSHRLQSTMSAAAMSMSLAC